ncbi:MAG: hypothetical protein VYA49_02410, partial [Planctomycetota bacterium]|nr:hypothetical protein [Planctomycetota bacterium]
DGRSIVHPSFNVGNDGRSIVHPQFNIGTNSGPGETSFMTGEDGRSIVHPNYNVGEDGRSIVHPNYNVGNNVLAQANQQPSLTAIRDVDIASESVTGSANPGGDDVFMPKPNLTDVWTNGSATSLAPFTTGGDGRMIVHPQYNVGEDGRMIVQPQYNDGEETLPTGTIISYEDSHLSAKDLIGNPPEPKIAPPAPHVSDRAAVIDGGSDSYTEVEWPYFASRQEVFARMGR